MVEEQQDNIDFEENSKSKIKRKIRAWCGLCYQFFENGPNSKNCKEHFLKGKCNLVSCRKRGSQCIRKFHNINSENRHTYCLTAEEVKKWDQSLNLQTYYSYLFKKPEEVQTASKAIINRSSEKSSKITNQSQTEGPCLIISYKPQIFNSIQEQPVMIHENWNHETVDKEALVKDLFAPSQPNDFLKSSTLSDNNCAFKELIFSNNDDFNREEDSLIDDFNKKMSTVVKDSFADRKLPEVSIVNNSSYSKTKNNSQNFQYTVKDDTTIDEIFDIVHNETRIGKSILSKLKSAYKKKGYTNVKVLRLAKCKNTTWDFLKDEFQDICTQVQGIALVIENLLDAIV